MFSKNRIFHYFISLAAVAMILPVSSCSVHRAIAPDPSPVTDDRADLTVPFGEVQTKAPESNDASRCVPEDCFGSAVKELRGGKVQAAKDRLKDVRARYPETIWAARAAFFLADLALKDKSDEALDLLEGASALTDIQDYLLFYRAEAKRNQKQFSEAISGYDSLSSLFPDSALLPDALFKKAASLADAGEPLKAKKAYEDFLAGFPKDLRVPDALLASARISMGLKEPAEAAKALRQILIRYPAHAAAKDAQTLLTLIKSKNIPVPEPSIDERFERAGKLFDAALYKEAISEYSYLVKNTGGEEFEKAALRLAVSEARLKHYDQAEQAFKGYLSSSKSRKKECEALYQLSAVAIKEDKEDLLLDTEKKLARKYPKSLEHARTLISMGRFYEGRGLPDKALSYYNMVLKNFRATPAADDALWAIGWRAYRDAKFEDAYISFSSYPEVRSQGKNASQFLYWSGRSAENAGRKKEALDIYEKLCGDFGRTYYCDMAEGRIKSVKIETENTGFTPAEGPKPGNNPWAAAEYGASDADPADSIDRKPALLLDLHYMAAKELVALGLNTRSTAELELLTSRYSSEHDALFELANLFYQAGDYHSALGVYLMYSRANMEKDDKAEKDFQAFSFPAGLVESVRQKSPEGYADPFLVAAVIREESGFDPKAISVTGALGLMQIMPATGKFVARELGEDFDAQELFNPDTNIRFGAWYLGYLVRKYNNDLVLAIAGYNAGPNAVERWIHTLPAPLDEFIESIPYTETRNYAKRVLNSYSGFMRTGGVDPSGRAIRPDKARTRKSPNLSGLKDKERS